MSNFGAMFLIVEFEYLLIIVAVLMILVKLELFNAILVRLDILITIIFVGFR